MDSNKIPMTVTIPGHMFTNHKLTNDHRLIYGLFLSLSPLRETEEITKEDLAEILHLPLASINTLLRDLVNQEYLFIGPNGLDVNWR